MKARKAKEPTYTHGTTQVPVTTMTFKALLQTAGFRMGWDDVRAGKPPRRDIIDGSNVRLAWFYERGRLLALDVRQDHALPELKAGAKLSQPAIRAINGTLALDRTRSRPLAYV